MEVSVTVSGVVFVRVVQVGVHDCDDLGLIAEHGFMLAGVFVLLLGGNSSD